MFQHGLLTRLARRMLQEGAIPMGRVLGVRLEIHPGGIFLAVVLAASLARGFGHRLAVLPADALGSLGPVLGAVLVTLALVFSVYAHELGHAVAARRCGIRVHRILLHLLGGSTILDHEPADASSELRVAIAGPLVNLALTAGFGAVLAGAVSGDAGSPLAFASAILTLANALIAMINLFPAYPLDGGRVLRAALWRASDDRVRATRLAAQAARSFAITAVLAGLMLAVTAHPAGLTLAFVGWFVGEESTRVGREFAYASRSAAAPRRRSSTPHRASGNHHVTSVKSARTTRAGALPSTPNEPPVQMDQLEDVSSSTGSR